MPRNHILPRHPVAAKVAVVPLVRCSDRVHERPIDVGEQLVLRLIAEKLLNQSLDTIDYIDHVQRGKDLEPMAVKMYEACEDVQTAPVGFLTTNDMRIGATPDRRIVGHAAYLEAKCPAAWTHLEYLIDGFGADYMAQAQGQIYVGEAEWVDRWSFHPEMPPRLVKTIRDDAYIADLCAALDQFNDMKDEIERQARASGFFEERIAMGQLALEQLAAQEMRQ